MSPIQNVVGVLAILLWTGIAPPSAGQAAEPVGLPLEGSAKKVECIAFSPDGKTLAGVDDHGNAVKLWDTATGKLKLTWKVSPPPLYSVAFSPDGKKLAIGGQGTKPFTARALVLDAETGKEQWSRDALDKGTYRDLVFSPDGKTLACHSGSRTNLLDAQTGELKLVLEGIGIDVRSFTFSPDGTTLLSGGWYRVQLWDAQTGKLKETPAEDKKSLFLAVAFSPDGGEVLGVRHPNLVHSWDGKSGQAKRSLKFDDWEMDKTGGLAAIALDGKKVAATNGNVVQVRDAQTGEKQHALTGKTKLVLLAFSRDGKMLATAEESGTITLWNLSK